MAYHAAVVVTNVNPADGSVLGAYDEVTPDEVGRTLARVHDAQRSWRDLSYPRRAEGLRGVARLLRAEREPLARLMAREMGKPLREGRAEIDKCAWVSEHYAEHAAAMLEPRQVPTDASRSFIAFEPLGVVLAVMPWNFPFWQVFRCAVPALMAGNAVVLKHAPNVPGCALAIERLFRSAGLPENVLRTLFAGTDGVATAIENPRIAAVTLTGSTAAGRAVARKAGEMLKKTVLELGGSDAYLVLADADLGPAVTTCVASRLINGGQSCVAAKRFVVVRSVLDGFTARFVEAMRSKKMGDPLDEASDLGPLARHDLRDRLHRQVQTSVERGARCLLGGSVPPGPGAYYPPTVLADVAPGMPAYDEELFGPVAAIIPALDDEDAVRIANDTTFGLGAAVFTRDVARGESIATERLEAGSCFVNGMVRSDPRLPFGGIKQSGYGRELGLHGLLEFVNVKTVWVG